MTLTAAFAVRAIVTRSLGLNEAGLYQSAWVLGGVYMGYILQAMGADFYPRLTAAARDNAECNRLINEQIEVGMLAAIPGVLATLAFTPMVMQVFYTKQFGGAVDLLRWISLGMLLRVASWPMGYFLMARGERKLYFWTEFLCHALYITLIWVGVKEFGLTGAGVAFFGSICALYGRDLPDHPPAERVQVVAHQCPPGGDWRSTGGCGLCRTIFSAQAGCDGAGRCGHGRCGFFPSAPCAR